jgi:glycosyltransferase involved in cell wall biosynthesis
MKILFCNYEYPPLGGGGGVLNAQLAAALAGKHDVTIITSQGLGAPRASVEEGVRVVRVPVFFRNRQATASLSSLLMYMPMGILAGKKLLASEHFDVVNTHFALPSGPVGATLARCAGIPNILTVQGGDLYDPSKFTSPHRHPLLRLWVRHLLKAADMVVWQSKNTLANIHRYYAPEIQGIRIPLGIQQPLRSPASRRAYGFGPDDVLLVTVGRLVPRKAIHQLLAMMEAIDDERVHLFVVGSGPQEAALRRQASRRRLENRVHFTGYVEETEKFRLLGVSDVYVSTTQHEGFCLSFLEAMASGLPIVCYDYGGHTDYLQDGETGYLTGLNDLALFTRRCQALIANPGLREEMGRLNRIKVEDYFIDSCAAQYESLFCRILEARRGKAKAASLVKSPSIPGD